MSIVIEKIDRNDEVFSIEQYVNDRLSFNYIEGARNSHSTQFFSDKKHIIICKKENNNSVWIWTDDEVYNNQDAVIAIANVIKNFANVIKPSKKPNTSENKAIRSVNLRPSKKYKYLLSYINVLYINSLI